MNFSSRGVSTSIGIPGTGISYRSTSTHKRRRVSKAAMTKISDTIQLHGGRKIPNLPVDEDRYWAEERRQRRNQDAAQWGCASLLVGIFLFFGFLIIGQNLSWAFGSLLLFGFLFALGVGHVARFARWVVGLFKLRRQKSPAINLTAIQPVSSYSPASDFDKAMSRVPQSTLDYFARIDPLLVEVAIWMALTCGSVSSLQRRYSIGFNRAGRIVDDLITLGLFKRNPNRTVSPTVESIDDLLLALDSITI